MNKKYFFAISIPGLALGLYMLFFSKVSALDMWPIPIIAGLVFGLAFGFGMKK